MISWRPDSSVLSVLVCSYGGGRECVLELRISERLFSESVIVEECVQLKILNAGKNASFDDPIGLMIRDEKR